MKRTLQLCARGGLLIAAGAALGLTASAQRADPCTNPDAIITVEIMTDSYGYETTWELVEQGVGVVASGGPYHIAHQAPGWIWTFPVSIIGGLIFLFFYSLYAKKIGGLKLALFAWPILFCTLGYNFLAYSFIPAEKGGGIAVGWLICGILFELMGGLPLLFTIKETIKYISQRHYRRKLRSEAASSQYLEGKEPRGFIPKGVISFLVFIINLGAMAAGIYLAVSFFHSLSG